MKKARSSDFGSNYWGLKPGESFSFQFFSIQFIILYKEIVEVEVDGAR